MKKFRNRKTKDIWYAFDKGHIQYFENNPNFLEVKEKEPTLNQEVAFSNTKKQKRKEEL